MDLAALDIKIGADLSQLQKDLSSAGVIVDQFSKDLATIGATSAAAAGGMSTIATGAIKLTEAFKQAPASVNALEQSLESIANEFNNKWNPIVEQAGKLPIVLDETSASARKLQQQFAAFGGLSPFKNVGTDLSKFTLAAKTIPDQLTKTAKASSTATLALGNLGRVAQDLPFGFIGIANNLNPLLEGFQRLAKESKATGVSIGSSLLKSLTGAGGLGLALSVVSAALTFASFGLSAWTRGFGDNKKAVDEAKEALDGYLKNAASEITSLRVLEKVATDTSNAYDVRKKAVDELQKSYPAYLGNLTDEAILNGLAAAAINEVAAALAKKAFLQASESTLTELANKQLKARQEELKLTGQQQQAEIELAKAERERRERGITLGGSGLTAGTVANDVDAAVDRARGKIVETGKALQENRKIQQGLNNDFTYFLNIAEQLKTETIKLDPDPNGKTKEAKKNIETIADVLGKLQLELSAIDARELNEGLNLSKEKITEIEGVIKKLIVDFKVKPDDTIINKLFGDIKDIRFSAANFKEFIQNIEKSIPTETAPIIPVQIKALPVFDKAGFEAIVTKAQVEILAAGMGVELPINWSVANAEDIKKFNEQLLATKSITEQLNLSVQNFVDSLLTDSIVAFGEALGTAFGGGSAGNVFATFFKTFGEGLQSLGKTIVATAPLIAVIKNLFKNPLLAIPAGIALIALGKFIESKVPKLAEGGIVPGGFPNDTYPALLSSNEAVIPLDKGLGKFLNTENNVQYIVLETKVSANDLLILGRRAERKDKRTF